MARGGRLDDLEEQAQFGTSAEVNVAEPDWQAQAGDQEVLEWADPVVEDLCKWCRLALDLEGTPPLQVDRVVTARPSPRSAVAPSGRPQASPRPASSALCLS